MKNHHIKQDTNTRPIKFVQYVAAMVIVMAVLCCLDKCGCVKVSNRQWEVTNTLQPKQVNQSFNK